MNTAQFRCYIGVGSNLGDPLTQVTQALRALAELEKTELISHSSFYQSDPLGPADQPRYINAVAGIDTQLPPLKLLDSLQQIENHQGRVRRQRWGARTLDLDLLLYADQVIETDRLRVPHPGIRKRSFVLFPLLEISADIVIPGVGSAARFARQVPSLGIEKLSQPASNSFIQLRGKPRRSGRG